MQTLVGFRESNFSPWGRRPRSAHRSPLLDASEKYSFCVGSISAVNQTLAEKGLHYPAELPPISSKPLTASVASSGLSLSLSCEDLSEFNMANGRRKGKKPPSRRPSHPPPKPPPLKKEVKLPVSTPDDLPPPSEEAQLVELASFPGFDPHRPTPLPHGLNPLEQMQRASRAQTMLSVKREGFRETWKTLFYKPASQAIFQDYFWWYFLHRYQNFKLLSVQNQLFNRISANYVSLLCEDVDLRWRDPFFKVYPDVMAQCVYSAFVHAYPASWSSFDDSFKSELIKIISLWQVGTRPLATAWKKWNLSILEPTNHLKHLSKEKSEESSVGSAKSPRKRTSFELDALLKEHEEKQRGKESASSSSDLPKEGGLLPEGQGHVHISFSNFERELASSLANERIHISASKERLVKTQAQATRELLTKNTRPAEQPQANPPEGTKPSASSSRRSSAVGKGSAKSTKQAVQNQKKSSVTSPPAKAAPPLSKNPSSNTSVAAPRAPRRLFLKRGSKSSSAAKLAQTQCSSSQNPPPTVPPHKSRMAQPSSPARGNTSTAHPQKAHTHSSAAVNSPRAAKPNAPSAQRALNFGNQPQQSKANHQAQQRVAPPSTKAPQRVTQTKSPGTQRPVQSPQRGVAPISGRVQTNGQTKRQGAQQPQRCNPTTSGRAQVNGQSSQKPVQPRPVPPHSGKPPQSPAQRATPTAKKSEQRQSVWKEKAMEIIKRNKELEQAPVSIKPATFEHAQFDTHGQSPLVQHFLNERSLSRENETKVLTGRTELVEEPDIDFISYSDIISEAIETTIKNHGEFKKLYLKQKKSMAKAQAARTKASQQHEQDVKQLLGMKSEVRHLSNEIAAHILNKHFTGIPIGKEKIAAMIEKALNRMNKASQ